MLCCRDFGFYHKPTDLSLIEHILFTGESGIKWKCIYTKIKDFKLERSIVLSYLKTVVCQEKHTFCFEWFS